MHFYTQKNLSKPFAKGFLNHLKNFIRESDLIKVNEKLLVTVSAGVDSVASLVALKELGYENITVVHFNHQKREASQDEELFVEKLSQFLGFTCWSYQLNIPAQNFEASARKERYQKLASISSNFDKILTAHHINDSLEWHLMSSLKSSSLTSSLGIPLKRGKYARIFHCFTKEQIRKFAHSIDLKFYEDHTNNDGSFERNYIRQVIQELKTRFKNPEKHFVNRQNQLVYMLEKSGFKKNHFIVKTSDTGTHLYSDSLDFSGAYFEIETIIKELSSKKRGELSLQIKKLISMANAGKTGPLSFSGGVKAYSNFGHIYFTNHLKLKTLKANEWSQLNLSEYRKKVKNMESYPLWIELKNDYGLSTRKRIPQYDTLGRYLAPIKLLYKWENDPHLKDRELLVRFIL